MPFQGHVPSSCQLLHSNPGQSFGVGGQTLLVKKTVYKLQCVIGRMKSTYTMLLLEKAEKQ
jgi:hypothetical protein